MVQLREIEETIWKANQEKKAIKRRESLESSDSLIIIDEDEDEEEEEIEKEKEEEKKRELNVKKKSAGKSLVEIRLECLAKDWLVAARTTSDEDKWGDDKKMTPLI